MWPVTRRICATVADARLYAAVIEILEERRLLTALPGAATDVPPLLLRDGTAVEYNGAAEFEDGVLTVHAYDGRHNSISFFISGSNDGQLVVTFEHYVAQDAQSFYDTRRVGFGLFPAADLKEIRVIGGDGDDDITVIPSTRLDGGINVPFDIPVTFMGGAGDDTLIGGQAADVLVGGAGHDWIEGGASRWLDREWFNLGWQGTDTLHANLPRHVVGDDTIGGGVAGEVLDGESDGNDMPAPPAPHKPVVVPPGPPKDLPPAVTPPHKPANPVAASPAPAVVETPPPAFSTTPVSAPPASLFADPHANGLWE